MEDLFEITVVDGLDTPFPPAAGLVKVGVPVAVAAAWERVRAEMCPDGLAVKLDERRN